MKTYRQGDLIKRVLIATPKEGSSKVELLHEARK